jgi:hypothetical protein
MHVSKNVIAAISGAIGMYMEATEQQVLAEAVETRAREVSSPPYSLWAVAGRQSSMDMRRFLQMRLAH